MFRLLRVKASGFRNLSDGIEINLLSRTRIYETDPIKQILEVDENLHTFKSVAVVGNNSSGKTSVLWLLITAVWFLYRGRFPVDLSNFGNDEMELETDFYLRGKIYFYKVRFKKPAPSVLVQEDDVEILEESLSSVRYSGYLGKKALDRKGAAKIEPLAESFGGSSSIRNLLRGEINFAFFDTNRIGGPMQSLVSDSFFLTLEQADPKMKNLVLGLLDDSIATLELINGDLVEFARVGEEKRIITRSQLITLLSAGTIRGLELFIKIDAILRSGGILFVDELETSFHKELVRTILSFFNSYSTNPLGAQLFFTTNMTTCLNFLSRRDAIFITHRNGKVVSCVNLKDGYDARSDLRLSNQMDAGDFGTNVDYEKLMDVKEEIMDAVRFADVRGA